MRNTTLSYLFLFFLSSLCYSQNYSIKGVLQDENNTPIAFANAILVDLDDINIVKGVITNEDGLFTLENIKEGEYIFKISFLGFKEYTSRVELDRDIDFETIILKETIQELNGVTVVAKRPTVKRLVDRTVFNVENSTLSNNNVLDVLKHTPGVLVNNGTISVKNSTPTVYINDRRVHLSIEEVQQLLEGTPANNIKSIEVITNPPAKYEAEGGAVLNIVTSKNIIAGYNGSVFGNFKQGSEYPKYAFGTSHFFKAKKLNTYLNYNISPKREFRHNDEFINFINDDNAIFSSWETDFKRTQQSANQNINANIDYTIDDKNSLGFSTNVLVAPREPSKTRTNSETQVFGAGNVLDSIFKTSNRLVEEKFNLAFTLDYLHKFNEEGEQISASWHHTNYDFSNFQDVNTGYFLPDANNSFRDNKFQTFSSQEIQIYTSQIDYELPLENSGLFEAGAKVSSISSESVLSQFTFENDIRTVDLQNSDTFLYDETNYAAYLSYAKDWESWSLKSGLRGEYTKIVGNSLSTNQVSDNDYFKLFPSLHLSNKLNKNNEVYVNYSKSIYRPRYSQLNPFKYFLNDNTFISGEPNLRPQIDNQFTFGYLYESKYNIELYYRSETNPILKLVFQDNEDGVIKYINTNIDKSTSYGIDFMVNSSVFSKWDFSLISSLFFYKNEFIAIESNQEFYSTERWTSFIQLDNYFTFLKDDSLSLDLSIKYISPWNEGSTLVSERSSLNINLRKELWGKKASVSIGVLDLYNSLNYSKIIKYLNQDAILKEQLENRLFTVGFNYKFGNFKLTNIKNSDSLEERDRLGNDD